MTVAGLFLLPSTIAIVIVGQMAGILERRIGSRGSLIGGALFALACYVLLVADRSQQWEIYVAAGLLGIGIGLSFSAMANLIVQNVRQEQTGVATGMNAVTRTLGGAFGGQLAATLLASNLGAGGAPDLLRLHAVVPDVPDRPGGGARLRVRGAETQRQRRDARGGGAAAWPPRRARAHRRLTSAWLVALGAGEVALARAHGDVAPPAQVAYDHDAARDVGERAVAAIDGVPDRAAHGRGAVAPAGAEAPVGAAAQAANDAARGPRWRSCRSARSSSGSCRRSG